MILDQLVSEWHAAGIEPGDTILIHTSLKRTFTRYAEQGHTLTPQLILDSFRQALGPEGTLLLPLFNFDFTKGVPFDMRTTPSQMGALTEAGRLTPGAVRTGHPIYSFAVLGRQNYSAAWITSAATAPIHLLPCCARWMQKSPRSTCTTRTA